jgi:ApaG protein
MRSHTGPQHVLLADEVVAKSAASVLLPWLKHEAIDAPECTASMLREVLRAEFRREPPDDGHSPLDRALEAMRVLGSAVEMQASSSCTVSRPPDLEGVAVRIEATSGFRGRDSASGAFVFEYRIRVVNSGTVPVQVIGRAWSIRNQDGSEHASVPRGSPGVVGQTPRLQPGHAFEYASGTSLNSPGGSIAGSLQMMSLDAAGKAGSTFDAAIDSFDCVVTAQQAPRESPGTVV